ncbi:MAG TPA: AgmX/PglI C-terminal domain-containing protein [Gemmatimonadaceae bacterium]|nr:AgmX/PglI C-terminal domain-containing protein [Gemmatimonadaceae bacterium]
MASTNVPRMAPAPAGPPPERDSTFSRSLRWEILGEEDRALVGSWATAIALGLIWLLLVWFGPKSPPPQLLNAAETAPITLALDNPVPPPTVEAPATTAPEVPAPGPTTKPKGPTGPVKGSPKPGRSGSRNETNRSGAIGDAFGTGAGAGSGGMVGDVSNVLRGVDVNSGSGGTGGGLAGAGGGGTGGKTVLGYGQGGQGSRTPGRGGIGGGLGTGGGGGGGIGGVGTGGGVARNAIRISAPKAIDVPEVTRARGDVESLGNFVRSRESQLRFCYNEYGLKVNPSLAGSITTAITLTGSGSVTGVDVSSRSWSGAGSSEAESCIRNKIRGWRFPSGNEGTYGFSFNFTR